VAALSPLGVGAMGVLHGASWLGGGASASANLDSHVRYLSGVFFALGLAALWCAADIARRGVALRVIALGVALGGLARLAGMLGDGGVPSWPHRAALVMELGVTPLLALWQASFARRWRRT
jgi:hypothetical protein